MASIPKPIRDWISQFFTEEGVPQSSADVDHDQTVGGTAGNPHADSAAVGDVSSIQSSADVDHDQTTGGTSGNPHADSAAVGDVSPIQSSADVTVTDTQVGTLADGEFLQNSGGSLTGASPSGAIDTIDVETVDNLPDPSTITKPTIAYVDSQDDYVGIFQS